MDEYSEAWGWTRVVMRVLRIGDRDDDIKEDETCGWTWWGMSSIKQYEDDNTEDKEKTLDEYWMLLNEHEPLPWTLRGPPGSGRSTCSGGWTCTASNKFFNNTSSLL